MGVETRTAVAATMYHEREKKSFDFSHCWIILNGRPKWTQVVIDLKAGKERNNGSSSHQSIGFDDEEEDIVVTMPKNNREVMGNNCHVGL
uniref:No apical meristem-associated C-terminal domain-containing protein n=1 Tax=Hordeum vulgare subsp. vulgare TaxID=112509 RepID=A0A8I6YA17_HORVV